MKGNKSPTIEDVIALHAAAFIASCTKLAMMLQDKSHVNPQSREWLTEAANTEYHRKQAFDAKNVLLEAEHTMRTTKESTDA